MTPGTVVPFHPRLAGRVSDEITQSVPAGALVKFPTQVLHDVRNLGSERCVIMFINAMGPALGSPFGRERRSCSTFDR